MGYQCYYFCGECDRPADHSYIVPEAFYRHPDIDAITQTVFNGEWGKLHQSRKLHPEFETLYQDNFSIYIRSSKISKQIQDLKNYFKEHLYQFAYKFHLETLIVENAVTIPVNIPLGLAITEFIAETGFPVVAHHHDFYWERQRFLNNSVQDYLSAAFPPDLPSIHHVVLNSMQAKQLASRVGVSSMIIPNVMDFDTLPQIPDDYTRSVRSDLGIDSGQYLILQPTRIIQRKGIEHAIELTRRLNLPAELVISHASGDEGTSYEKRIHEFASLLGVTVNFVSEIISNQRGLTDDGRKIYTLEDIYPYADLVTYPSAIEGFGNAFLEAIYYKRPLVVNNYSIYETDIKPKGFKVVEFDGFISDQTLNQVRDLLEHPEQTQKQVEFNYSLARRYYSYTMLENRLRLLLSECYGERL